VTCGNYINQRQFVPAATTLSNVSKDINTMLSHDHQLGRSRYMTILQNEIRQRRTVLINAMMAYHQITVTFTYDGQPIHDDEYIDQRDDALALATGAVLKRTSSHQQRIRERRELKEQQKLNDGTTGHTHTHRHHLNIKSSDDNNEDDNDDMDDGQEDNDGDDESNEIKEVKEKSKASMGSPSWLNITVVGAII
jgi:hypothetical protein